jgi:hypothetical protein
VLIDDMTNSLWDFGSLGSVISGRVGEPGCTLRRT